jgi:two-component system cell cycle sensor histidine kinase/response regulator CckA
MSLHIRNLYLREADRQKLLVALTDKGYVRDYPVTLKRKDGRAIFCLITASLYQVRKEAIEGIQGIIRDITDKLELEGKIHQAQKMEALGRLAGGISHDFNNLLTAMFGQVELMRSALEPSSKAFPFLQDIQDTSERAAELTRRLLAFSRKQPVKPRLIHLVEAIRSAEKLLYRLIGEDVRLVMDLCPPCRPVKADPVQIEQILINLAVNSRDAMPNGGELSISTKCITVDGKMARIDDQSSQMSIIRLTVSDTGTGIPDDVLPYIFEPYFTTKPETEGTGMGLATVFGIVDQLGGHVEVKSTVNQGTTFIIDFPTSIDESHTLEESSYSNIPYKGRGVVLIVEDDEGVRLTTQELLRNLGYQVEIASTPEEGMRLYSEKHGQVDVLLSDIVMPGMSGPEMVSELRKSYPDLKVLFMSGHTPQEFQRRGLLKPDDEILQKPFTIRELAEKIHNKII